MGDGESQHSRHSPENSSEKKKDYRKIKLHIFDQINGNNSPENRNCLHRANTKCSTESLLLSYMGNRCWRSHTLWIVLCCVDCATDDVGVILQNRLTTMMTATATTTTTKTERSREPNDKANSLLYIHSPIRISPQPPALQ